jgi:hypothetical protein
VGERCAGKITSMQTNDKGNDLDIRMDTVLISGISVALKNPNMNFAITTKAILFVADAMDMVHFIIPVARDTRASGKTTRNTAKFVLV